VASQVVPQFRPSERPAIAVVNGGRREVAWWEWGFSPVTRAGSPDIRTLTLTAAHDALTDAGLVASDLDARIFEYSFGGRPPKNRDGLAGSRGIGAASARRREPHCVQRTSWGRARPGWRVRWTAAMAIAAGACETALVYRTITRALVTPAPCARDQRALWERCSSRHRTGTAAGSSSAMAMKKRRRVAEARAGRSRTTDRSR